MLKWRDFAARLDDESPSYMMPNHILFQIAKDLPQTMNELGDCCRGQSVPAVLKYADQIIAVIEKQL